MFSRDDAGAGISGKRDHPAVPVQRLLRARTKRRRSTATNIQLEIGGLVDNKKPWTLAELYTLPQVSQITRHVCVEGWSAIGSWQGTPLSRFPEADRRRHDGQICLVPVRRGLFQHHRHADRAASADPDDVQVRRQDPAARLRLPDEDPDADQARLQEPEIRHRACGCRTTMPAAIGKTRATTGSAGARPGYAGAATAHNIVARIEARGDPPAQDVPCAKTPGRRFRLGGRANAVARPGRGFAALGAGVARTTAARLRPGLHGRR